MGRTVGHDTIMVKFMIEKWVGNFPVPNLAQNVYEPLTDAWHRYSREWPYTEPVHFFDYLRHENMIEDFEFVYHDQSDINTLYPISLSHFDFSINWFKLVDQENSVLRLLQKRKVKLWFLYSEADHPLIIITHLRQLAKQHHVDPDLILLTTANSAGDGIDGCSCFVDDELLFRQRNRNCWPVQYHESPRNLQFTALSRTHKPWRAATMARLWSQGYHKHGFFSYEKQFETDGVDALQANRFYGLENTVNDFLQACPFTADHMNTHDKNNHTISVDQHFHESYLNVVLETHLDIENSGGCFLTEKTFKPIKNAQMFIIVGAPGSIAKLREMGYRTFDHVIDNNYDMIQNPTLRWHTVMLEVERLVKRQDLYRLYQRCKDDIIHNQNLFLASKADRLNTLLEKVKHEPN